MATQEGAVRVKRVFLSYGHRDGAAFAERLRSDLERAGISVFHDQRDVRQIDQFDADIERGIDTAHALLAVLSPHAVRRAGDIGNPDGRDSICLNEIRHANKTRKPIVPVMIERCEPPLLVNLHDYIDFAGWSESADLYRAQFQRLMHELTQAVDGRRVPSELLHHAQPWDFSALIAEKSREFHGREWLFDEIEIWARQSAERVMLLVADPGFGKSATLAAMIRRFARGRVLAHHFCQADTPATLEPGRFVRILAAQIADALPEFAVAIRAAEPREFLRPATSDADPASAFEAAVVAPLSAITPPADHAFILVDGLDEAVAGATRVVSIPDLLAHRLDRLPAWLKVVATSRRDAAILDRFAGARVVNLDAQDPRNLADLQSYVEQSLRVAAVAEQIVRHGRASSDVAKLLCKISAGSFLYAHQTLRSIARGELDPGALDTLPRGVVGLFRRFFERSWPDDETYRPVRPILEVLLAAREWLTERQICEIAGVRLGAELRPVMDALSGYVAMSGGRVALFHRTLADWLVDPQQCDRRYLIDTQAGQARLLNYCRRWAELHDTYALAHYPAHLADAGQIDELWALLHDSDFPRVKAERLNDPFRVARDFGRLAVALAEIRRDRDLIALFSTDDPARRDATVAALIASTIPRPRLAAIIATMVRRNRPGRLMPGRRGLAPRELNIRHAAMQLAVATGQVEILAGAADDRDPAVRMALVPHIFRLWGDQRQLGWETFVRVRARAIRPNGLMRARPFEVLVGLSLAILGKHFDDPAAVGRLRAEWQTIIASMVGSPLTRIVGRQWVLSILIRIMKIVMARQPNYQPFNFAEVETSIARPPEFHRHALVIADHLAHPERGHAAIATVLAQRDIPFDLCLMLAAERSLVFHGSIDPLGVIGTLETLHERGCPWFRQSNLYVLFHVLKRLPQVEDAILDRFNRIACETIESTRATLQTESGVYQLVPHMAWADAILARHRPTRGVHFIPRFFASAMAHDDMAFARRTIAAAQLLSFAYRHHQWALDALRPALLRDDQRLRAPLIEALANIRFSDEQAVTRFLAECDRQDLLERVSATAASVRAADFPTWVDEFFNLLLIESVAFRTELVRAFHKAAAAKDAGDMFGYMIARVMALVGGNGRPR